MTTEEKINKILDNDEFMLAFISKFVEEINSDEESYDTKFRQLAGHYLSDPEFTDNILINLCGWSMDSLCDMVI